MILKGIFRRIKRWLSQQRGESPIFKIDGQIKTEHHGADGADWTIEKDSLTPQSVVYSFGVGTDISFDLALLKKYGCPIYAFDPTPEVKDWLSKQSLPPQFQFSPMGLSHENAKVKFYLPEVETHISHSAQTNKADARFVELPVKRLKTILEEKGHTAIDVLKMDIEGFEYSTLDDILSSKIPIRQLLVEFHHGMYGYKKQDSERAIEKLKVAGYKLFSVSDMGLEYSFIKQ